MIQRIQSIYLLLTAILMAVSVFAPLGVFNFTETDSTFILSGLGLKSSTETIANTPGIAILAGLSAIIAIVDIFLFNNRKLQMTVGRINFFLIIAVYITGFVYMNSLTDRLTITYESIQYGVAFPVLALIFNTLAVASIKKDENLVQSLNRIR